MKAVQGEFTVDLFCFRNDQGKANTMEGVRQVMIYQDDFAVFKNYAKHDKEKFRIRLRQAKVAAKQIKKIGDNYDLIVVQHMMFLLEMGKEAELLRSKVVLYPMFTGTSYVMSGEKVPSRYMKKEKSGTSYVELSEAIKSNSNIIMMSKNKRNVLQHQLRSFLRRSLCVGGTGDLDGGEVRARERLLCGYGQYGLFG